jgi:hypothetical protein
MEKKQTETIITDKQKYDLRKSYYQATDGIVGMLLILDKSHDKTAVGLAEHIYEELPKLYDYLQKKYQFD